VKQRTHLNRIYIHQLKKETRTLSTSIKFLIFLIIFNIAQLTHCQQVIFTDAKNNSTLNPEYSDQFEHAVELFNKGNFTGAALEFKNILKSKPDFYDAFIYSAKCYIKLRQYYLADIYLKEALLVKSNDALCYKLLSDVNYRIGDFELSRQNLKKAIQLDRNWINKFDETEDLKENINAKKYELFDELSIIDRNHWEVIFRLNDKFITPQFIQTVKLYTSHYNSQGNLKLAQFFNAIADSIIKYNEHREILALINKQKPDSNQEKDENQLMLELLQGFPDNIENEITEYNRKIVDTLETGNLKEVSFYKNIVEILNEYAGQNSSLKLIDKVLAEAETKVVSDSLQKAIELYGLENRLLRNYESNEPIVSEFTKPSEKDRQDFDKISRESRAISEILSDSSEGKRQKMKDLITKKDLNIIQLFNYMKFEFRVFREPNSGKFLVDMIGIIESDSSIVNKIIIEKFKTEALVCSGDIYFNEGNFEKSVKCYLQALKSFEIAEEKGGKFINEEPELSTGFDIGSYIYEADRKKSPVTEIYDGIIKTYRNLGRYDEVQYYENERYQTESKIGADINSKRMIENVNQYSEIADAFNMRGFQNAALKYFELALRSATAYHTIIPAGSVRSEILLNIASIYQELGVYRIAESSLVRALAYDLTDGEDIKMNQMYDYYRLGLIYELMNKYDYAIKYYEESVKIFTSEINSIEETLVPGKKITFNKGVSWEWNPYWRLGRLYRAQEKYSDAYTAYNTSIVLIESVLKKVREDRNLIGFQENKTSVYSDMIGLLYDHLDKKEESFDYAEKVKSRALVELLLQRGIEGTHQLTTFSITNLQRELNKEPLVIIEYYFLPDKILVYGINAKEHQFKVDVLKKNEKEITPGQLELLIRGGGDGGQTGFLSLIENRDSEDLIKKQGRELYNILFPQPIQSLMENENNVCIVPHGILHLLPFHVLSDKLGYLIDTKNIFYSSSSSLLVYSLERGDSLNRQENSVLGIGLQETDINTGKLLKEISQIYPEPLSHYFNLAEISQDSIISYMHRNSMILLYTHGKFNLQDPMSSYIELGNNEKLEASQIYKEIERQNLNLKAKLITLFACESGKGDVSISDEVLGLPRALIYAGAATVIVSLWSSSVTFSEQLALEFYKNIKKGSHKSEALRQAIKQAIELSNKENPETNYNHPYYWGPFVMYGDYR
jgi:CHAT domain-containing protein